MHVCAKMGYLKLSVLKTRDLEAIQDKMKYTDAICSKYPENEPKIEYYYKEL